jgi:hypothetical protein
MMLYNQLDHFKDTCQYKVSYEFCPDDQNRGRFINSDGPQMVVQALALEDGVNCFNVDQ